MIKTILWDVDGTLLDFLAAEEAAIRAMDRGFHTNDDPDDPTSEGRLASRPTGF